MLKYVKTKNLYQVTIAERDARAGYDTHKYIINTKLKKSKSAFALWFKTFYKENATFRSLVESKDYCKYDVITNDDLVWDAVVSISRLYVYNIDSKQLKPTNS